MLISLLVVKINSVSDMGQASREETAREPPKKHLTIGQLLAL